MRDKLIVNGKLYVPDDDDDDFGEVNMSLSAPSAGGSAGEST